MHNARTFFTCAERGSPAIAWGAGYLGPQELMCGRSLRARNVGPWSNVGAGYRAPKEAMGRPPSIASGPYLRGLEHLCWGPKVLSGHMYWGPFMHAMHACLGAPQYMFGAMGPKQWGPLNCFAIHFLLNCFQQFGGFIFIHIPEGDVAGLH